MKIDHIGIYVCDIEKVKEFFLIVFDAQVGEIYVNEAKCFCSYFLSFGDSAKVEIMHRDDIFQSHEQVVSTGFHHISFSVGGKERVDEFCKRVIDNGYKVIDGPRVTGDGFYEFVFIGPENIYIEVTE